jgi:hypothetical protein
MTSLDGVHPRRLENSSTPLKSLKTRNLQHLTLYFPLAK